MPSDGAGNTLSAARDIGLLSGTRTFNDFVGQADTNDYYRFTLNQRSDFRLTLTGLSADADVQLLKSAGSVMASSTRSGSSAEEITRILDAGTYFVRVCPYGSANRNYTLGLTASASADAFENDDSWERARAISTDGAVQRRSLHTAQDVDWVRFTLAVQSDVVIETRGPAGDTVIWLYGANGSSQASDYDDNNGMESFSRIVRTLPSGTYHVRVASDGANAPIPEYTLSVTALQPGNVFLTQGGSFFELSTAIRSGERLQLGGAWDDIYSHAAIHLGNNRVAEMGLNGYVETNLTDWYSPDHTYRADIFRHRQLNGRSEQLVEAVRDYSGTPYAYSQIAVLSLAALHLDEPPTWREGLVNGDAYSWYLTTAHGTRQLICSELVARAFADADPSLTLSVQMWPAFSFLGNSSDEARMDFTTPTVLSRSPTLRRLNA